MKGLPNRHTKAFRAKHLSPGEQFLGYLEGSIRIGGTGYSVDFQPGQLILTNKRCCLYRKEVFGERLQSVDLRDFLSIETSEGAGHRYLKICANGEELIFKTNEEAEIFQLVLDRLSNIRADPNWLPVAQGLATPVQISSDQVSGSQPPFSSPARKPIDREIERLAIQYELDELFLHLIDRSAIGLNFREQKLLLATKGHERTYRFDQIVSVEATANEVTLSQTNRGSQFAGAAVGGALLGGTGLLLGGLTGSSRSTQRVKELALKVAVDDRTTPFQVVRFFSYPGKKGLDTSHPTVLAATTSMERIHAQLILAMRQAETSRGASSETRLDGLERLWGLKESGALSEAEFHEQKTLLLDRPTSPQNANPQRATRYALNVLDWGTNHNRVQAIATLRELEPSLGLRAAAKICGSPSYRLATDIDLKHALRIKARLSAVGVVIELAELPE